MNKNIFLTLGCILAMGLTSVSLTSCGTKAPDKNDNPPIVNPDDGEDKEDDTQKEPTLMPMNTYFSGARVYSEKEFDLFHEEISMRQNELLAQDIAYRLYNIYGQPRQYNDYEFTYGNNPYAYKGATAKAYKDKIITNEVVEVPTEATSFTLNDAESFQKNISCMCKYENNVLFNDKAFNLHGAIHGGCFSFNEENNEFNSSHVEGSEWKQTVAPHDDQFDFLIELYKYYLFEKTFYDEEHNYVAPITFGYEHLANMLIDLTLTEIIGLDRVAKDDEYIALLGDKTTISLDPSDGIFDSKNPARFAKFYRFVVKNVIESAIHNTFDNGYRIYPQFSRFGVSNQEDLTKEITISKQGKIILMPKENAPTTELALEVKHNGKNAVAAYVQVKVHTPNKTYDIPRLGNLLTNDYEKFTFSLGTVTKNDKLPAYNGTLETNTGTNMYEDESYQGLTNGTSYIEITFDTGTDEPFEYIVKFNGMNDIL